MSEHTCGRAGEHAGCNACAEFERILSESSLGDPDVAAARESVPAHVMEKINAAYERAEQERALKDAVVKAAMAAYDFEDRLAGRTPYEAQMSPDGVERERTRLYRTRLYRARHAACAALAEFRSRVKEQG